MKRIFIFSAFLLIIFCQCQDLSYNLLHKDNEGSIYGKRESLNDVWIKSITKKKDKNGKYIKNKEISFLYTCNCEENKMKSSEDFNFIDVNPDTVSQLIVDYTCHNIDYKLIGSTEDGFLYYASNVVKKGKVYDVWIKRENITSVEGDKMTDLTIFDPKTGKVTSSNESVEMIDTYNISKYRINCNNNKMGKIVEFVYKSSNDQLHLVPIYFDNLGMKDVEYDDEKLIMKHVCTNIN